MVGPERPTRRVPTLLPTFTPDSASWSGRWRRGSPRPGGSVSRLSGAADVIFDTSHLRTRKCAARTECLPTPTPVSAGQREATSCHSGDGSSPTTWTPELSWSRPLPGWGLPVPRQGSVCDPALHGPGPLECAPGQQGPGATWRVAPSVGHGGCSGKFRFGRVTECAVLVSRTERESHWTSAPPYRAWTGSASSWRRRTPPEGEVSGAPGSPGPLTGQEAWETRATPWEPRTPEGRDRPAAPVSQTQRPGPRSGTQRPGPRSSQGAGGRGGRQRTHSVRGRRPSL